MSGWHGSDRRARLPADWAKRRAQRLELDGYRCVLCGQPATDVDHVVRGDNHELDNLQSLCTVHHKQKTQAEAQAARSAVAAKAKRRAEPHPGLIDRVGEDPLRPPTKDRST